MRPTDLTLMAVPGRPTLRGELLLTAVARPDLSADTYSSALHRVRADGVDVWTHADSDTAPALSPDGRWVAFLRADDGAPQLHVMPSDGGEARRLTELPLGAGAPVWAPDSRRVAFTARVPEPGRYGTARPDEDDAESPPPPEAEAPRRITRWDYRVDDVGYLRDRPRRLFVVEAAPEPGAGGGGPVRPEALPLTDGAFDVADPAWTPDGRRVLVFGPSGYDRVETLHRDLYAVSTDGDPAPPPELVVRCAGAASGPVVDEDGTVYFLGTEFDGFAAVARNTGVWAASLPEDGSVATPRRLTDGESVDCAGEPGPPTPFGDRLLVAVRNRGAVELRSVPRRGDRVPLADLPVLTGTHAAVRGFAVDGTRIAVVLAGPSDTGEVVLFDTTGVDDTAGVGDTAGVDGHAGTARGHDGAVGTVVARTDFAAALRAAGLRPAEELTARAPDGYPVHGWLVLPEGEGPHPTLLMVHGGPFAQYDRGLVDEAQVYASAGYAVVLGNPRGSAGYGEAHARAVVGAFGTVDADDLLALLDAATARPDVSADRVGVMGGSYGGFMTGWLAAHHGHRFRAAWSERAVNAWDSFTGSSDIGWFFTDAYVGDDPEVRRRSSPLTYADRITIPFAVVHSEQDWRCPIEQAQRMFVALRRAGTETEMLVFPGEGHELTRSGRPRHRVQRFEAVLDWWGRHLPVST